MMTCLRLVGISKIEAERYGSYNGLQGNSKDDAKVAESQRPDDELPGTQIDRALLILSQKVVQCRDLPRSQNNLLV